MNPASEEIAQGAALWASYLLNESPKSVWAPDQYALWLEWRGAHSIDEVLKAVHYGQRFYLSQPAWVR